ncbi:unnamed protein product [Taenia asiatica]|uniref:RING-type E3 ubiquitin transferase n=1 Tax=Taenia asiatica TaxID=60517 RepID=A0A0R3VX90_TAEAS|nr:unnamed protein product [Taenia asiatica]
MDCRPPCKFYQSGFCARGDECPFSHPTKRCRSFTQDGFCPYGIHCHYWHDFKNFALSTSTGVPVQKVCRFFLNGQCSYGDTCAYSHQLDDVESPNQITLSEYRLQQQIAQLPPPNPLTSLSPRLPAPQPGDLEKMRDLEVDRLLKRFPPSQLKQTSGNNDEVRTFSLIFSSTDPEWVHKVKRILLFISLPGQYPSSPPILNVPRTSDIPSVVTARLNEAITNWINERQSANASTNKVSLFLRPFFFWLDKALNRLLIDGYALAEGTEAEENAGLQIPERFDSPTTLCLSSSRSVTVDKTTFDSKKMGENGKKEESVREKQEKEGREKQEEGKTKIAGKEEGEGMREQDEGGEEEMEVDISMATIRQQDLFFEGLGMRGQAGTCLFVRLPVYCTCSRCKYAFEWVFRLPSSPPPLLSTSRGKGVEGAAAQTQPLTSVPPHTSSCQRCRQPLGLIFTSALIHAYACCVGTFQLANCLLSEVQVGSAEVVISCANCCNAEARIIVSRCRF